jgi:hypothetical protein
MIVDEYVIVKNSIYYRKLGYESDDRYISIKVIDLAKNIFVLEMHETLRYVIVIIEFIEYFLFYNNRYY